VGTTGDGGLGTTGDGGLGTDGAVGGVGGLGTTGDGGLGTTGDGGLGGVGATGTGDGVGMGAPHDCAANKTPETCCLTMESLEYHPLFATTVKATSV
tara:strand:- start:6747 stop:7037 length:291 start_codon:yes stop_codon:yes gene_type:complete